MNDAFFFDETFCDNKAHDEDFCDNRAQDKTFRDDRIHDEKDFVNDWEDNDNKESLKIFKTSKELF